VTSSASPPAGWYFARNTGKRCFATLQERRTAPPAGDDQPDKVGQKRLTRGEGQVDIGDIVYVHVAPVINSRRG